MNELVVVTGPPGAGKSTVSRVLSSRFTLSALVRGDDFFAFIDRGYLAPWTPEAHRQNEVVIGAAAAAAGRLTAGGYTVVYDGVIGPWSVDAFARAAGLASLHYAVLLPPEQVCLERVQSRTGHGFTDLDATRHMYAEFAGATVDARHVIDEAGEPETLAVRLQNLMRDGSLERVVEPPSVGTPLA